MTILTMVKYEWFEEWKDTTVRKRGDQYHQYKMRFAKRLFDWASTIFPKIKDKVGGSGRSRSICSCSVSRSQRLSFVTCWKILVWQKHDFVLLGAKKA